MSRLNRHSSGMTSEDDNIRSEPPMRRTATVYDAVAGKITQDGFLGPRTFEQKGSNQPLRPDEVLFKQARAPTRFEETDYYFAHKRLPPDQQLPSGELLEAIHAYISKLYSRTEKGGSQTGWTSMDETALIAFGILMEETVKEVLGETGDLAFLEAARSDEEAAFAKASKIKTAQFSTGNDSERQESEVPQHEGTRSEVDPSDHSSLYASEYSEESQE